MAATLGKTKRPADNGAFARSPNQGKRSHPNQGECPHLIKVEDTESSNVIKETESFVRMPISMFGKFSTRTTMVYLAIKSFDWGEIGQGAFPSVATIAKRANVSKPTALKGIAELRDAGVLTVEHRFEDPEKKIFKSSRYMFPGKKSELPSQESCPPGKESCLPPGNKPLPEVDTSLEVDKNKRGIVAEQEIKNPKRVQGKRDQEKRATTLGPGAHNPETAAKADRIVEVFKRHRDSNDCLKPGTTAGWTKSALVLLQRRGGDADEVIRVLKYALAEEFWSPQLKDLYDFGKRYDQFRLMAQENKSSSVLDQHEIENVEDIASRFFDLRDLKKLANL